MFNDWNIDWRWCISYRLLNSVTRLFEFLFPVFLTVLKIFDIRLKTSSISPSTTVEYASVVRENSMFTTDSKNKSFVIIPFGTKNTIIFYTSIMQLLHDKFIFLNWAKNIMPFHTFVVTIFYDKKLSLITILFNQTTFLLSFTICLVKIESWLNIYYYLNLAIVIFSFVKLRMLDMTELRMEIMFFNWMFSSENNVLFHLLVYLFSFSLSYIFSSSIISYYSSSILNLPLVFSTNIIVKNFNRFLDYLPLLRCSSNLL